MRESLFASDEAIIAVLAHEIFELNKLYADTSGGNTMSVDRFDRLTKPGNEGNYHALAWDYSNEFLAQWRIELAQRRKDLR